MVAGVYFLLQGAFDANGVGKVKISLSGKILNHTSGVKCYNGDGVTFIRYIATRDRFALKKTLLLHFQRFNRKRLHKCGGDWFDLTIKQINDACELYKEDQQYTVEDVFGHRGGSNSREYHTLWTDGSTSWQPQENFFENVDGEIEITECLKKYWGIHPFLRAYPDEMSLSEESSEEGRNSEDSNDEESEDEDYESSQESQESQESSSEEELDSDLEIYD